MVSVNVFIKVLSVSLSPPRLLIVKATCVPSASPPCACGNLLLVFKEQRSHRGGLGEVCATDSGAGQVNEPYCLPLQISVRQQPLAFCLLLAPHTHTHTHFTHSCGRHTFHTLPGDSSDGHKGVALTSGGYRLYLTVITGGSSHIKASMAARVSNGS